MPLLLLLVASLTIPSCVSKKQFDALQSDLNTANEQLGKCGESLSSYMNRLTICEQEKDRLLASVDAGKDVSSVRLEQIQDLKDQLADCRSQRDKQLGQVEDLTSLSQSASDNIKETLSQLEERDKYVRYLQAAKTRADSVNLALAVNLKSVLKKGIEDDDVEVKVDKTVVFVNLSDKMLYKSGSYNLTSRADEVLAKIATIIESRPNLEVMVEGYTDNVPIKNDCLEDNWDLSIKRSTSVIRALQNKHNIDPNRLIAAGRGEYNTLADNSTAEGRSINRRTRIIILPKLDQFYDLLNPTKVPD